jgi:integrase
MPLQLYKRGKKWHYRGSIAGRRLRGSTGAEDRKIAERVAAKIQDDTWKGHLDGPAAVLTFAQAVLKYRAAGKETRHLPPIEDYWKETLVKDITEGAIIQSSIELLPKAKAATRNRNVIVPTRAVINHCARMKLCPKISVEHFETVKVVRDYATLEWIEAFMEHANPHLGALALFMFLTGARISEALRLQWKDVDFARKVAFIGETKAGNPDEAHLPQTLIVALGNITRREPNRPVFWYMAQSSAKEPWRTAIKRAGIRKLSFHSCRHGFATALLRAGVDVVTIAKLGRWKSPEHVFKTYGHANEDRTVTDLIAVTKQTQPEKSVIETLTKTGT